jgi:phosphoribosylformimino-5-aminoimidazole carboxamide ribotide isomerase
MVEIFPAIDLKDGKAVRLTKGVMDSAKIYSDAPWELAAAFEKMGAKWLHIVDLNGAFAGEPRNLEEIRKIRENTNLKIEIGGGIRNEMMIGKYINEIGVERVILGSIATRHPDFVENMAKKYPIAVGIDAIDGKVAVDGWAKISHIDAVELAIKFSQSGVEAVVVTDISRDGTLSGVNIEFTERVAKAAKIFTIASGGVKGMEDIQKVSESPYIDGVIVGKAFYEGNIDLELAFEKYSK